MLSLFSSFLLLFGVCVLVAAQDPIRPYPIPDASLAASTTSILNHSSYLVGIHDPQWYLDNIPFADLPDSLLQDLYYYRQSVVKRHLKFERQGTGWIFTEFAHPVDWASKFQTIPDSAGHQIVEARWLRDPSYVRDFIQAYTRAGVEKLTGITYTNYVIRAAYEHAQVTGDVDFLSAQLEGMVDMFYLWNSTRDSETGLYFCEPVYDAQEYSLVCYVVGGPNGTAVTEWDAWDNNYSMLDHGPLTYRPSHNAYMVANSRAIADVAQLSGRNELARTWTDFSSELERNMVSGLWNDNLNFWIDVVQGTNLQVLGRQLVGYFPYRFGIGTGETFEQGLEFPLDSDHFLAEFGPTTLEKTNEYYSAFKNLTTNTMWNGQSWPFSTSFYLNTLATMARNNVSSVVTPEFFYEQLYTYAKTNTLGGLPFTGECHYPTVDSWSAYDTNHSENYFHSTYADNVFTNLLGIIPTLDDRLELRPLIPSNWTNFAVENIPYHGALVSLLWDKDGTSYLEWQHDPGFSIYINSTLVHHQASLAPLNVTISGQGPAITNLAGATRYANMLANPNTPHQLPQISADTFYQPSGSHSDSYAPWKLNDGLLWYDTTPDNRWSMNGSSKFYAAIGVTLPRPRTFNSLSLAVFSDLDQAGMADCPQAISIVNNRTGDVLAARNPWTTCVPNALNTILLAPPVSAQQTQNATTPALGTEVTTDQLQIVIVGKRGLTAAFSELQIWVPSPTGPRYEVEDGLPGTFVGGFWGTLSGMNNTLVLPAEDDPLGGGVTMQEASWVEVADVRSNAGSARKNATLMIVGAGNGTIEVQMNFLANSTANFDGSVPGIFGSQSNHTQRQNVTVPVDFLPGGNVVTLFCVEGEPFIDAIIVG